MAPTEGGMIISMYPLIGIGLLKNIVNKYVVIASTVVGESMVTVTYVPGRVAALSIAITIPVSESIP